MALKWVKQQKKPKPKPKRLTQTQKLQKETKVVCLLIVLYTAIVTWITRDLTAWCIVVTTVMAAYTTVQSLIIKKNERENLHKYPEGIPYEEGKIVDG